ncbi:hypothetical protein M441DRAFT_50033 [Trichoderma asperellum CBS 433.97]|uniref:Uncharacterized protein n=1 Tax=Trichoderma asperellum (strain ATCC 204424 / CBS 433.97 / NBRC 101777) TaxID=1042311 RepID=A0A2T3YYF7_TRIA4|nr:hypothetical protein M441DRAFT_50033 [Trichoderma asperellum CBS 433.97]PTB37599.1 hypothetical protein M441DRAFT_50033 [Trichoderma asperellum CBS 433.97]
MLKAVSKFVQPRQPPCLSTLFRFQPHGNHEQSCLRKAYATQRDHVQGSQILGLRLAIAQAMAQLLPTPAGQPQSAEVLVAVLVPLGAAITTTTTFDFAIPAGSTSAANDICRVDRAMLAIARYDIRSRAIGERCCRRRGCECSSRPCGSCRDGHTHGLSIRTIGSIPVTTNHNRPSRLACKYAGMPHLLTPTTTRLIMHPYAHLMR